MALKPVEKLIVGMLCDLSKDRTERIINYPLIETMLIKDQAWEVDWDAFINGISGHDIKKSRLVVEILDMCMVICESYHYLSDEDQEEFMIFNDGQPFIFYGFCPNLEREYYELEQLYLYSSEYYQPLRHPDGIGGNGLKLPRYLRILRTYKKLLSKSSSLKRITKNGLIEIISV